MQSIYSKMQVVFCQEKKVLAHVLQISRKPNLVSPNESEKIACKLETN